MHRSLRSRFPRSLLAVLLLPLAGCYSHAVTSLDAVSPGQQVRITVTPASRAQISPLVGSERPTLEGELAEITDDGAFYMTVPSGVRQEGFSFETLYQKLRFAQEDVVAIETRRINRSRTALLLGGMGVVVTAVILDTFTGRSGGNTEQSPGENPAQVRIPWTFFTIP